MRLTREGKRFLLATALLTFAAFNTGNNLIYLVLALMFSVIAISAVAPVLNMRELSIRVSLAEPVFANQEAVLVVTVTNRKRLFPSYSLRVIMPEGIKGKGLVSKVAPVSAASVECMTLFEKRGVYRWGDFMLESEFPFIFISRRISVPVEGTVTVYPRLVTVNDYEPFYGEGQSRSTIRPGRGEDLLSIREFRAGDDVKLISWKATAKASKPMVRELAEESPEAVNIVLDDLPPFDSEAFERAVSYSASLAMRLLEYGYYVGLVTAAKRLPYGNGPEQLYKILDVLAVAKESEKALSSHGDDYFATNVLVLKSAASSMRSLEADTVVYAS